MYYVDADISSAVGGALAHRLELASLHYDKGHILSSDDICQLLARGVRTISFARCEQGEIAENEAALRIGKGLLEPSLTLGRVTNGRCDLYAENDGILKLKEEEICRLNRFADCFGLATLANDSRVGKGQKVASFKVIPYTVPERLLDGLNSLIGQVGPLLSVLPFQLRPTALVQTYAEVRCPDRMDSTARVIADTLATVGQVLNASREVLHQSAAVAESIAELVRQKYRLILIMGPSATMDVRDVIPRGIVAAGGTVVRHGVPVDPGNLLLVARVRETDVLVLPGCARSAKANAFHLVLQRLATNQSCQRDDLARLGVGGLL